MGSQNLLLKKGLHLKKHQSHLSVPENVTINVEIPWTIKGEGEGFEEKLLYHRQKLYFFTSSSQFYENLRISFHPSPPCQIRRKKKASFLIKIYTLIASVPISIFTNIQFMSKDTVT